MFSRRAEKLCRNIFSLFLVVNIEIPRKIRYTHFGGVRDACLEGIGFFCCCVTFKRAKRNRNVKNYDGWDFFFDERDKNSFKKLSNNSITPELLAERTKVAFNWIV